MAENTHMFDNDDVFTKDESIDSTVTLDTSETLATQGNVINSLKIFWARLRAKLKHAVTRQDFNTVGNKYIPVYVDDQGVVRQCNGTQINISAISNNNINIGSITPIIGTTLSIKVTVDNSSTSSLTINNKSVFYPTGVEVDANIIANTNLLVVYNGTSWILINKMNDVKTSGKTSSDSSANGGYSGLMTADDKAKLETIDWDANAYSLPPASTSEQGGVMLGASKVNNLGTPTATTKSGRYYPIQTDKNNKLVVNVPWENDTNTYYKSSITTTSGENAATIKIVEKDKNGTEDETLSTSINIKGQGLAIVNSDGSQTITIKVTDPLPQERPAGKILKVDSSGNSLSWVDETTYEPLSTDNNNYVEGNGYLVPGSGNNNDTSHYLSGKGTWERVLPEYGMGNRKQVLTVNDDGKGVDWKAIPILKNNATYHNYSSETGNLVYGPGESKAKPNYVLAGNGSWVKGLPPYNSTDDRNKMLIINGSGELEWAPLT